MADTIQVLLTFNKKPEIGDDVYIGLNGRVRTTPPTSNAEVIGKVTASSISDNYKAYVRMKWTTYTNSQWAAPKKPRGWTDPSRPLKSFDSLSCIPPRSEMIIDSAVACVKKSVRTLEDRVNNVDEELAQYAANLSVRLVEQMGRLEMLTQRVLDLEKEAEEAVTIEPISLTDILRLSDARVGQLTETEAFIDSLAWKVFDNVGPLKIAGGHYNLGYLGEDIVKFNSIKDRDEIFLTLEDCTATALRWCKSRTRWLANARYWVQPCAGTLIIKRNRFIFQVKEPPEEAMSLDI